MPSYVYGSSRNDTVCWDCNRNESNAELGQYHIGVIRRTLNEISNSKVAPGGGVRVWKLYSSGHVVRTPGGIWGVDVVQGSFFFSSFFKHARLCVSPQAPGKTCACVCLFEPLSSPTSLPLVYNTVIVCTTRMTQLLQKRKEN